MARTFRATLGMTQQGTATHGKVVIDPAIVDELGLQPGETVRAQMRNTDFMGKVHGSMKSPSLLIPVEILTGLGIREGQGVRVTIVGRE